MCIRYLLEVLIKGIGKKKRTSIFPCGIFQMKKGVNRKKGEANYDMFRLALKATAKRLYPNYANCDWSVQVNAVKQDRDVKRKVLVDLTQNQRSILIKRLIENPVLEGLLGYRVINNELFVIEEVSPLEEMGTMGKWKYAAHVKSTEHRQMVWC